MNRRLLKILAGKRRKFDAYARRSAVAEGTPDAVGISEPELARQIIEAEQLRMAGPSRADRDGPAQAVLSRRLFPPPLEECVGNAT